MERIAASVRESGVVPSRLGFEITETAAVKDLASAEKWIFRLKELGCRFALDDFGVGFSSFAYLHALPVDYLKIDGSFVRFLGVEPSCRAIVQAINDAAHALGRETIAEFVENERILGILPELKVNYAQGYYGGNPGRSRESLKLRKR